MSSRVDRPMLCPKCRNENLSDAAFCSKCGAKLEATCPSCGLSNPPGAKFCRKCGSRLSTTGMAASVIDERGKPLGLSEGERRHLTVLFSDLVSSTEIASHLDPERWRESIIFVAPFRALRAGLFFACWRPCDRCDTGGN